MRPLLTVRASALVTFFVAIAACTPTPTPLVSVIPAAASSTSTRAPAGAASKASTTPTLSYSVVENIEMVPFCLPYPPSIVREVPRSHGTRAFESKSGTGTIVFGGTCSALSLRELYERDVHDLRADHPTINFTETTLRGDAYSIGWQVNGRNFYGKMWPAPDDAKCFVHATLEYDEAERELFEAIIAKVSTSNPRCEPRPASEK